MSNHTPAPWEIKNSTDVFTELGAKSAQGIRAAHNDGWHIARFDTGRTTTCINVLYGNEEKELSVAEKTANAVHAVHCVNIHDELLNALKSARSEIFYHLSAKHGDEAASKHFEIVKINNVISKAKGEPC